MPRQTRGTTYPVKGGVGIIWQQDGARARNPGPFRNKTEAHRWFDEHIAPQLRRGGVPPEITFDRFCSDYLERWGADVSLRTVQTVTEWLAPARAKFGRWTLAELEGAANDFSRWRATLPTDDRRHKVTRAVRQVLAAAVRWGYITRNPALDFGHNTEAQREEIQPLTPDELDAICDELADSPQDMAIIVFAAETGLRTNEWIALERRDIDWRNQAVAVARRYADGRATPYPKTGRRSVPLTPRALEALGWVPARLDTPLLFPAAEGGHIDLDNWRLRVWYPALDAAGIARRGPYNLRHTFATEALAAGVSIHQLARPMGASVRTIDRHYAHLAHDSHSRLLELLSNRNHRVVTDRQPEEN